MYVVRSSSKVSDFFLTRLSYKKFETSVNFQLNLPAAVHILHNVDAMSAWPLRKLL
jgi:hypothetical protein